MGSFNVSCGLSNLTIHEGDAMGLVLLSPKPTYATPRGQSRTQAKRWHVYPNDLYDPYAPPLYGTYDDYGRLTDLEESGTTRALEEFFRRPAIDVINAAGEDREIYSSYGAIGPLYLPEAVQAAIGGFGTKPEDVLAALDFMPIDAPHPYAMAFAYDGYVLAARQREDASLPADRKFYDWDCADKDGNTVFANMSAFNGMEPILAAFANGTKLYPGFDREDWHAVHELKNLSVMFFLRAVFDNVKEDLIQDSYDRDAVLRQTSDYVKAMEDLASDNAAYSVGIYDLKRNYGMQDDEAWRALGKHVDGDQFRDLILFERSIGSLNRMLTPNVNGDQFGNDAASLILAKATIELLEARMKDREEWDEEDED